MSEETIRETTKETTKEITGDSLQELPTPPKKANRFKRLFGAYWRRKPITIPLTVLLIAGVILAVPASRYPVLGLFLQRNYAVIVLDESSKKPVSSAQIMLGDAVLRTNSKGQAKFHVAVGSKTLTVSKKYYKSSNSTTLVPINQKNAPYRVFVVATGRQVPITVINKVTGKPIAGALITAADTESKTDNDGKAIIVLPADKKTITAKISLNGYNSTAGTIEVSEQKVPANTFQLVTSGKIYFLSKLSGKIDVVKTNLDGTERQTVLAGTGKESPTDTILLAARDWKYLALKSTREGGTNAKLYLIDTSTDKVTTMDEGNADFTAVGWSGHQFAYSVYRSGLTNWQPKVEALKTYNAETNKLVTLDETDGQGTSFYDDAYNRFSSVYILDNELVYTKNWSADYYNSHTLNDKQVSLFSIKPDGSAKKTIKDFPVPADHNYYTVSLKLYEPHGIYLSVPSADNSTSSYYEYEDGKVAAKPDVTDQQFNDPYTTYLASPSGKQTFWSDPRDGKSTLFIGDADGQNSKQIASLSEYTPYGWYSDDYLLVSKNSSELYIMPVAGGAPIKISDYHKPNYDFTGYGGGYGGL